MTYFDTDGRSTVMFLARQCNVKSSPTLITYQTLDTPTIAAWTKSVHQGCHGNYVASKGDTGGLVLPTPSEPHGLPFLTVNFARLLPLRDSWILTLHISIPACCSSLCNHTTSRVLCAEVMNPLLSTRWLVSLEPVPCALFEVVWNKSSTRW